MDTPVWSPVGLLDEAYFTNRPELRDKRRNLVRCALAVREEIKHGILRRPLLGRGILRIGNQEAARAAQGGLVVTAKTLIAVEPCSQTRRVGLEHQLGSRRVDK